MLQCIYDCKNPTTMLWRKIGGRGGRGYRLKFLPWFVKCNCSAQNLYDQLNCQFTYHAKEREKVREGREREREIGG